MIRREFAIALVFLLFGVFFTPRANPPIRVIQLLLPLVCGFAAGLVAARGLWLHRIPT